MDYTKVYNQLIESAISKNRKKVKNGPYYENHHIIPKCMGGSDDKDNTVLLKPKEHYMAHKLLCAIYPKSNQLRYAFWLMINAKSKGQKRYKTSSRIYENERLIIAEIRRETMMTAPHSLNNPEMIKKCTEAKLLANIKRPDLSSRNKQTIECPHCNKVGPIFNMKRWHFDNCKTYTGVTKEHPKIECPHCNYRAQAAVIKKWHLDNCKYKTKDGH